MAHLRRVTVRSFCGSGSATGAPAALFMSGCLSRFTSPRLLQTRSGSFRAGLFVSSVTAALSQTDICTLSGFSLCCELHCAASLVRPRAPCLSPGRGGRQSQISLLVLSSATTDTHTLSSRQHREGANQAEPRRVKLRTTQQVQWSFLHLQHDGCVKTGLHELHVLSHPLRV